MKSAAEAKVFASFSLIGAVFAVIAVALNGLAIDVARINASAASALVLSVLFFVKYGCYRWAGIIVAGFWRYTAGNLLVTLLSTIAITALVDIAGTSGAFATTVVIGVSFVMRYIVLRWLGVIRRETLADGHTEHGR